MLISGCCAVSDTPAVWVWKRICQDRSSFARRSGRAASAPRVAAPRGYFAISSKKSMCALKKNESRGATSSTLRPASWRELDVGEAVGEGEGELLGGRRARPRGCGSPRRRSEFHRGISAAVKRDGVAHEPHRRARGKDELLLGLVLLQDVVLQRAAEVGSRDARLLGVGDEERQHHRGRRVDGHRRRDGAEIDAGEEVSHVGQRVDGDAAAAHLADGHWVVGVESEQRRHVKRGREAGATGADELAEALVGVGRGAKAREHAHRPELRAVHRGVTPARVRVDPGNSPSSGP